MLGGLVLGVANGMSLAKAAETFTVLSVGDALVSQLPALLVSSAAGVVVTRSATGEQLGRAFLGQLMTKKRPMTLTAGILTLLGLMPGMPFLPCVGLAAALVIAVRSPARAQASGASPGAKGGADAQAGGGDGKPRNDQAEVEAALTVDLLSLELGYELVGLVDVARGGTLLERVASLRQQLARECGMVVPPVNVCDNLELAPGAYRVLVSGVEVAAGKCRSGFLLALDPSGSAPPIDGEATIDPAFGAPARWIAPRDREMAEALGYAVVDDATVLATHLGEVLRAQGHKLLGRQEVQQLLEVLARRSPKLVDDVVPNLVPLGDLVRVLRNLLREGVSIRDMRSILEGLAELAVQTKDPEQLTEFLRERLSAQITARAKGPDGGVTALTLDPRLEELLRRSLRDIASGTGGAIDPNVLHGVTASADRSLAQFAALGAAPVVVCPPDLRRYVRAIVERKTPQMSVVSFREIDPSVTLRVLGNLSAGASNERQGALSG
jgi:flagellar biosynthesis protein FlhA